MNKKQALLTNLITKIKQPKTSSEEIINGLTELEKETKFLTTQDKKELDGVIKNLEKQIEDRTRKLNNST